VEWWIVDGALRSEPIPGARTVFGRDGFDGWIIPGLVDAHCHVGLGPHGAVGIDEAVTQAQTERGAGALLLRDCGSPIDTRSLAGHHDLPEIIRAGRHLARPKRYSQGYAIELADEWRLPQALAEQARRSDGWVKIVGDWIDRSVGDLAPLWSDDVLAAAVAAAHAEGARVTAHVFGEDALPGLIGAGIDCIEHGTGLTDDALRTLVLLVLNLVTVKLFGEIEFWFAMIKVATIMLPTLRGLKKDPIATGRPSAISSSPPIYADAITPAMARTTKFPSHMMTVPSGPIVMLAE